MGRHQEPERRTKTLEKIKSYLRKAHDASGKADSRISLTADRILLQPLLNLVEFKHLDKHLDFKLLEQDPDANILSILSHPPDELGKLLREYVPTTSASPMSKRQQAALRRHQTYIPKLFIFSKTSLPRKSIQSNTAAPSDPTPTLPMFEIQETQMEHYLTKILMPFGFGKHTFLERIVRDYITIFDDLFFFGSLQDHFRLKLRDLNPQSEHEKERSDGISIPSTIIDRMMLYPRYVSGKLDRRFFNMDKVAYNAWEESIQGGLGVLKEKSQEKQIQKVLSLLLERMITAFFLIFTCHCRLMSCIRSCRRMGSWDNHGPAWRGAALAIQKSARDVLCLPEIDFWFEDFFITQFIADIDDGISNGLGPWFDCPFGDESWGTTLKIQYIRNALEGQGFVWDQRRDRVRKTTGCSGCDTRNQEEGNSTHSHHGEAHPEDSIDEEEPLPLYTKTEGPPVEVVSLF